MITRLDGQNPRAVLRRAGRWVIVLFWGVQFVELTTVTMVQGRYYALHILPERAIVIATGMVLSLALVEISASLEGRAFRVRLLIVVASALALSAMLVGWAYLVMHLGVGGRRSFDLVGFIGNGFTWSWFFLSIAAAILALTYSLEVRESETRLAGLQAAATEARIAALRYQLNPHFLFNTLNSVVALIDEERHRAAEEMVESLSDFLRASLELDPISEVTLARELELQALYLSIEQVRFPERLRTEFHLLPELRRALVPALITQPLIENSIRHAVARSSTLVTVRVTATRRGDTLRIVVENDGGTPAGRVPPGTGVGLANVGERLRARFGDAQSITSGILPQGGYRTELQMPFKVPE